MMKQVIPWVVAVGCAGLALVVLLRGESPRAAGPAGAAAVIAPPGAPGQPAAVPDGPVVHTFEDEAKMQEFAQILQQRQALNLRIAVLQMYWNAEQTGMAKLNEQLQSQYQLDPAKNYVLDGEHRVLREREVPPPTEAQASTPPAEPGTIVHTFANEEEMQTFATLWQQRQGVRARMAMLQTYWNPEQAQVAQIDKTLNEQYHMDVVKKTYFLDGQRRALIERPAPPAAAKPAAESDAQPSAQPTAQPPAAP